MSLNKSDSDYTLELEKLSQLLESYSNKYPPINYPPPVWGSPNPLPIGPRPPGPAIPYTVSHPKVSNNPNPEPEPLITNKMILDYLKVQSFLMKEILDSLIELKKHLGILSSEEDQDLDNE